MKYLLSILMKRADEVALAELYGANGELLGRTLAADWLPPDSVHLVHGKLTIWNSPRSLTDSRELIRAPHGLLDRFITLAHAPDERSIISIYVDHAPSNERISRFAARYGGLQIFYEPGGKSEWPATDHIEHCEVWRYFARAMRALQRIASDQYRGGPGSEEDWRAIRDVPTVMRSTARKSSPGLLHPIPLGDETYWLALAHFVGKHSHQNRVMFGHLINTLLGLGCVRPWLSWSDGTRQVIRPNIIYSSRSLLSQLALQLCLRLAKIDAFLVCTHCQKPYSPVARAPKQGLRHFCPECRGQDVPQKYALRDFKERQKRSPG